jgi:hypothetical protein
LELVATVEHQVSAVQTQGFVNAAGYATREPESLRRVMAEHGLCADAPDPEEWFPLADEAESRPGDPLREQVRALGASLCWGCPVRGACLALSLASEREGTVGIWGGLGSQDRAELRPLWHELRARLSPVDEPDTDSDAGAVA